MTTDFSRNYFSIIEMESSLYAYPIEVYLTIFAQITSGSLGSILTAPQIHLRTQIVSSLKTYYA